MKKTLFFIFFYTSVCLGQSLDTISKIEIFYGYGAQCFPRDGVYARSEKFIFEKLEDGNFELATYQKLWNISRQNATKFSKDSSITNLSRKCDSKILLDLIKNLNADKQNFSFTFLKAKIKKPSKRRIIKLSKKMDNFYKVDCYDFFDCEYRNQIIDSIQNFEHFDKYVSSINLSKNQMITIGYYNFARITITSKNNITSYDFSFVNNAIGQPIIKNYNENYMVDYAYVNLLANEIIRDLIPKNSITYKAFDLKKVTDDYIRWYLDNN